MALPHLLSRRLLPLCWVSSALRCAWPVSASASRCLRARRAAARRPRRAVFGQEERRRLGHMPRCLRARRAVARRPYRAARTARTDEHQPYPRASTVR
eukprot:362665-Chlamydomonas_euryale.AAC.5